MAYAYVIYDGRDRLYLALSKLRGTDPELCWTKYASEAWKFPQSWQAEESRDQYGFFGCEVKMIETAPVEMTEAERWPRRLDWPLVKSVDEWRKAVLNATGPQVGIRVPVLCSPAVLAFEPLGWGWVDWESEVTGDCFSHRAKVGVKVTLLCGYFPYKVLPTEWHVEYQLEFHGVPDHLIPDSFKRREAKSQQVGRTDDSSPEHWPTIRPDEFQEFEDVEHLEYDG